MEGIVETILSLVGFQWLVWANPIKVVNWILDGFDWIPSTINSVGEGNWTSFATDVLFPIILGHAQDIVSNIIKDSDIPIVAKFGSLIFAVTASELNAISAAAFLAVGLSVKYLAPPQSGQFCSPFWAPPTFTDAINTLTWPGVPDSWYHYYRQFHFSVITVSPWGSVGDIGGGTSKGGPAGI